MKKEISAEQQAFYSRHAQDDRVLKDLGTAFSASNNYASFVENSYKERDYLKRSFSYLTNKNVEQYEALKNNANETLTILYYKAILIMEIAKNNLEILGENPKHSKLNPGISNAKLNFCNNSSTKSVSTSIKVMDLSLPNNIFKKVICDKLFKNVEIMLNFYNSELKPNNQLLLRFAKAKNLEELDINKFKDLTKSCIDLLKSISLENIDIKGHCEELITPQNLTK